MSISPALQQVLIFQIAIVMLLLALAAPSLLRRGRSAFTVFAAKAWLVLNAITLTAYVLGALMPQDKFIQVATAAFMMFIGLGLIAIISGLVGVVGQLASSTLFVRSLAGSDDVVSTRRVILKTSANRPRLVPRETFGGIGNERPFNLADPDVEVIRIYNDIDSSLSADIGRLVREAAASSCSKVRIELRSCGGDSDDGFYLRRLIIDLQQTKHVEVLVTGYCASAAILLLLAVPVENRFSMSGARYMVHSARNTNDMSLSHSVNYEMLRIYVDTTNVDQTSLDDLFRTGSDYWFDANQALELGFVGTVIST